MTVSAFVVAWFMAAGYPAHIARAIDHVAYGESRGDYCVVSDSGFRGLLQWDSQRWSSLRRFAGVHSDRCPPLEKQLAFADIELRQNFRCFFRARTEGEAYRMFRATFAAGRPC